MTWFAETVSLETTPLPRLLHLLYKERYSGVARLSLAVGPAEIRVRDGEVVGVSLPGDVDRLGQVFAAQGLLDDEALRRSLQAPRAVGLRYGRMLVDAGIVTDAQLAAALRLQIRRRLHRLFFVDGGAAAMDHENDARSAEPSGQVRVHPYRAIYQGVLSAWNDVRFGGLSSEGPLRIVVSDETMLLFGWSEPHRALLRKLATRPTSRQELIASAESDELGRALFYVLAVTDAIIDDSGRSPALSSSAPRATRAAASDGPPTLPAAALRSAAAASPVPPPLPPRSGSYPSVPRAAPRVLDSAVPRPVAPQGTSGSSISPDALARVIAQKVLVVETEDHFQILGVSREASRAELKTAYLAAAKTFHPDRLSAVGLSSLRTDAERIFRRVSDAYATLTDDARRAAYLNRIALASQTTQPEMDAQRVMAGELAFREGEVAWKRRDLVTAMERLGQAVSLHPREGEAVALYAWVRLAADRLPLDQAQRELRRAVDLSPRSARSHYYLGMTQKQLGSLPSAIASFRRAVELDEHLAEAQSELRVLSTRITREQQPEGRRSFRDFLRKK